MSNIGHILNKHYSTAPLIHCSSIPLLICTFKYFYILLHTFMFFCIPFTYFYVILYTFTYFYLLYIHLHTFTYVHVLMNTFYTFTSSILLLYFYNTTQNGGVQFSCTQQQLGRHYRL